MSGPADTGIRKPSEAEVRPPRADALPGIDAVRGPKAVVRGKTQFLHPGGLHAPFMRRLRRSGHDPAAFARDHLLGWVLAGLGLLALLGLVPLANPQWGEMTLRIDTILSLTFFLASVGLWFGMRSRAFAVAGALAGAFYAVTAWVGVPAALRDIQVTVALVAFLVFALAGFNLVFILEEMVHDAHRLLRLKGSMLQGIMLGLDIAVALGIPLWHAHGGPALTVLWWSSLGGLVLLGTLALLQGFKLLPPEPAVVREMHLFVVGTLAAALLVDVVHLLRDLSGLVPSLVAYGVLLGTWVYVTYTTLQRTHFLLRGADPRPWMAILFGASFAILGHAQALFASEGSAAIGELLNRRFTFLAAGAWIGIAFYLMRGIWLGLVWLRGGLPGARARRIAGAAANVAAGLMATEDKVGRVTYGVYRRVDRLLPGRNRPPERRSTGWERELGVDPGEAAIEPVVREVQDLGAPPSPPESPPKDSARQG